ncbi:MAG: TRAP transporter small permease [Lachnospiraceae bacterium]|nr:TRAP transporter small permease [Lachnospiraceae bacterium]
MKKISDFVLKIEEILAGVMLCMIAVLVFWSAVARTIGMPVNWAQDVSLLAFAWLTFIGSDIIIKGGGLIRIDMLVNKFPKPVQKVLMLIFDALMLLFLLILIVYGFLLVSQSWNRTFNTLKMSYAWCTLAVPVGSFLMFFSAIGKTVGDFKKPVKEWGAE